MVVDDAKTDQARSSLLPRVSASGARGWKTAALLRFGAVGLVFATYQQRALARFGSRAAPAVRAEPDQAGWAPDSCSNPPLVSQAPIRWCSLFGEGLERR